MAEPFPPITVNAVGNVTGTIPNTGHVTATPPDPNGTNNSSTVEVTNTADLRITKSASLSPVVTGQEGPKRFVQVFGHLPEAHPPHVPEVHHQPILLVGPCPRGEWCARQRDEVPQQADDAVVAVHDHGRDEILAQARAHRPDDRVDRAVVHLQAHAVAVPAQHAAREARGKGRTG